MFGEKSLELIKELKRTPDSIPPYNDDLVRQVQDEIKTLFDQNQKDVRTIGHSSDQPGLYSKIEVRHAAIERNRRCLLAYLYNRCERLKRLRWDMASVLPADIKVNLSESEQTFFHDYNRILANYMRSLGEGSGVDLTQNRKPPKSLYIEVRSLQDYGEFETSDGITVVLKTNSLHSLPRIDCESLIRQGVLEHVH